MAKATGPTQKSKCPPQSVSGKGDPINEYIKNVSKNVNKKGKDDKGCKGCDQALNASIGLRSIYRVLGDNKFVTEAKQAERNLITVSKLSVLTKVKVILKLFGNVIETVSAISAKEGIPLPDLLLSIAKRQGMIENMMDTVQSTLFDFINIVKTIDKQVSLKQTFKVYAIVQSFSKTVKTIVGGMISMMLLQKFAPKAMEKAQNQLLGEKGMIYKVLNMYASVSTIMTAKLNPKKMEQNMAMLSKGINNVVKLTVPFGEAKSGILVFTDSKDKKNFVNMNVAHNNIEKLNQILNEIIDTHAFIRKLSKMAVLTTLAIPGLLISNMMISVAMWSFNKLLNTELVTGMTKEMGVKLGIGEKFFNLFRKEDKKVKAEGTETQFLEKIKGFQKVLNAMLFAYIKISAVLGTISIIMLAVGGIAGFAKLGLAIGMMTGTIGLMFMSVIGFSKMFEKSKMTDKQVIQTNTSIGLILLSFLAFTLSIIAISKVSDNIHWGRVGLVLLLMMTVITSYFVITDLLVRNGFMGGGRRKIKAIAESTLLIASSFLLFAIAIAALSFIKVDAMAIVAVSAITALMLLMISGFSLMSKYTSIKTMWKMVVIVNIMSIITVSLIAFTIALLGISIIAKHIHWEFIGITMLTLGFIVAVYGLLSMAFSVIGYKNIALIAVATLVISSTLVVFAMSLLAISILTSHVNWNFVTLTMVTST